MKIVILTTDKNMAETLQTCIKKAVVDLTGSYTISTIFNNPSGLLFADILIVWGPEYATKNVLQELFKTQRNIKSCLCFTPTGNLDFYQTEIIPLKYAPLGYYSPAEYYTIIFKKFFCNYRAVDLTKIRFFRGVQAITKTTKN